MIFDYQSAIVEVFRKFFDKGCILKYYLQNMWISTILDNFLKILLQNFSFLAIFLEFFVLENNHTLQDPLYTRSITLILCRERNKKIRFHIKSFANRLETCKSDLYKSDTCKRLATSSLPIGECQVDCPLLWIKAYPG